jgi:hypothetical protein
MYSQRPEARTKSWGVQQGPYFSNTTVSCEEVERNVIHLRLVRAPHFGIVDRSTPRPLHLESNISQTCIVTKTVYRILLGPRRCMCNSNLFHIPKIHDRYKTFGYRTNRNTTKVPATLK